MAARKASTVTEEASKSSVEGRMTGKQYFMKNSNLAEEVRFLGGSSVYFSLIDIDTP
jgi:hypothetical protein